MVEDKWLLLASIPVVVFLSLSIRRRLRDLNARIEQLKREEAAGPINPYQAMYEMVSPDPKKAKPGQKASHPLPGLRGITPDMGGAMGLPHLSPPERNGTAHKPAVDHRGTEGSTHGDIPDADVSRRQQEDNDG